MPGMQMFPRPLRGVRASKTARRWLIAALALLALAAVATLWRLTRA